MPDSTVVLSNGIHVLCNSLDSFISRLCDGDNTKHRRTKKHPFTLADMEAMRLALNKK